MARKSSGDDDTDQLVAKILANADGIAAEDAAAKKAQEATEVELSALLQLLPGTKGNDARREEPGRDGTMDSPSSAGAYTVHHFGNESCT